MHERCFYTDNNDPYFYLSPLKLEVVMKIPIEIYIYHDIITKKEINTIKTQANFKVRHLIISVATGRLNKAKKLF